MKKLFSIILVLGLLWSGIANAETISDEKCGELAADAKTDWAAEMIFNDCYGHKKVMFSFQYDEYLTCAIKAGKARTESAARNIYYYVCL